MSARTLAAAALLLLAAGSRADVPRFETPYTPEEYARLTEDPPARRTYALEIGLVVLAGGAVLARELRRREKR